MTEELRMRKDRDIKAPGDVIDMTSCEDDDDDDGLYHWLSLVTACSGCEPVHQHADGMHNYIAHFTVDVFNRATDGR